MLFHYRSGEAVRTVRVEPQPTGYRVTVEERSSDVVVRRSDGPFLDLLVDGRPVEGIVVLEGDRRIVKVGDADPVTLLRAERSRGGGGGPRAAADGRLVAAMDGQVVAVAAKQGERVEAGATLAVVEAMKMEIRVIAPFAGRVRSVLCAAGDVVRRGRVLIELDPETPGGAAPR
jgi:biotin carboxyl carrier protein